MSVFVTGTDTGVGKTFIATALLRAARAAGVRCAGFKPICCGDRQDAEQLLAAGSDGVSIDEVNPLWFKTPVAPITASEIEDVQVDEEQLLQAYSRLRQKVDYVVVEGVGGWLVPIARDRLMSDVARRFCLPVLLVAMNRLGCLNHTLLTLRAIAADGLECSGIVLNNNAAVRGDIAENTNARILRQIVRIPVLDDMPTPGRELPETWRGAANFPGAPEHLITSRG